MPAPGARGKLSVTITRDTSTIDNSTAVFSLTIMVDGEVTESYSNLTMDPDDVELSAGRTVSVGADPRT